ncbi:hypothetical protein L226DRAFT_331259 [Lentinus tigrinus ALCF2SS1-7]|uniref:Uncharacterized protein n=1 Tax=Lentinus tigrinus ALCF2SS1-6 TaxID=1328759 RepID=A0A5C2SLW6_9APHY|nr:hypothetical protein L227DRAFT_37115 [Lentinus tigrinus ALCF2SS1-6]RPD77755.1 hypothetical protein L226DRAFT_331259 [Lentinus tigrinus ALCF2SS1-7]
MFRSTAASFPTRFIAGDVLDPHFLSHSPPFPTSPAIPSHMPPGLSSVNSLNELKGHVSAIFTGAFFHLFTFDQQTYIARLLSPRRPSLTTPRLHALRRPRRLYCQACIHSWTRRTHAYTLARQLARDVGGYFRRGRSES